MVTCVLMAMCINFLLEKGAQSAEEYFSARTLVPPRSQIDLNTKVVYDKIPRAHEECTKETWGTELNELERGLMVARTILPDRVYDVPVRVMNAATKPVKLEKGTPIGEIEPLEPLVARNIEYEKNKRDEEIVNNLVEQIECSFGDLQCARKHTGPSL